MKLALKIFILLLILIPGVSSAHSFGRLYNLPVPFSLYLFGGAGAMLISFLFIGYFLDKNSHSAYPRKDLSGNKFFNLLTTPKFISFAKYTSFFLFVFTILSGLFGTDMVYSNWSMPFFWIIVVLGFTYFTAIFGNTYEVLNPWKTLTDWVVGKNSEALFEYPKKLGYLPAFFFYFIFIWIELIGETTPSKLAVILIAYTIINDLGVVLWGRNIWYKYCEFFSVFFRMIGKIAPLEYNSGKLYLRPPFMGALKEPADSLSLMLFIIFMLASTAFDGFKETLSYTTLYFRNIEGVFRPIFGNNSYALFETLSLAIFPLVFFGIYLLFIYLAKVIAKSHLSLRELALNFAFSLLPIVFVYHIAHYYTLLFTEGPTMLRLISDPLGLGHNFFGTKDYYSSFILPINFIWHSQVALILLGHIVSVYLSHVVVLKIFPDKRSGLLSQFPMLCLMVIFTVIGLWILAQPITGGAL